MGVNGPVTLTIDVLAFEGFTSSQANDAAIAFRDTLALLIETRGMPGFPGASAVSMELPRADLEAAEPARAGARLAEALYRRLGR